MKNKILLFLTGILCLLAVSGAAQTNQWYRTTEFDVQSAPTFWFPPVGKSHIGFSVEGRYWENIHTATAIEIGNNDLGPSAYPGPNYLTTKQYWRVTPFPNTPFFNRSSVALGTGIERWLYDGSTGIPVQLNLDYVLPPINLYVIHIPSSAFEINGAEHFDTQLKDSGLSGSAAFVIRF